MSCVVSQVINERKRLKSVGLFGVEGLPEEVNLNCNFEDKRGLEWEVEG